MVTPGTPIIIGPSLRTILKRIMKRILAVTPLIILTIFANAQTVQTFKADVNTGVEEEIKKLEFFLASLLEKGDLQTYADYLTDDYIRINQNGIVSTKEQVLALMRSRPPAGKMNPHDLAVRVYGNTAILNGKLDIETKNGDAITRTSSVFTKVFIRKEGKWYLASLQGTPAK
jgi:ketosteroid isomerase-like protein